jgi:hypothetical protein
MNMKKIAQGIAVAGVLAGAGAGLMSCSNTMRQRTLNNFYQTAAEVQTELRKGNTQNARESYERMWDAFNQTRRDELRDPLGQMTQADADTFEARANWNALQSPTNNLHIYGRDNKLDGARYALEVDRAQTNKLVSTQPKLGLIHSTEDLTYKQMRGHAPVQTNTTNPRFPKRYVAPSSR